MAHVFELYSASAFAAVRTWQRVFLCVDLQFVQWLYVMITKSFARGGFDTVRELACA
jgi:hypothetical protein